MILTYKAASRRYGLPIFLPNHHPSLAFKFCIIIANLPLNLNGVFRHFVNIQPAHHVITWLIPREAILLLDPSFPGEGKQLDAAKHD